VKHSQEDVIVREPRRADVILSGCRDLGTGTPIPRPHLERGAGGSVQCGGNGHGDGVAPERRVVLARRGPRSVWGVTEAQYLPCWAVEVVTGA
jgi:hypothetical protein